MYKNLKKKGLGDYQMVCTGHHYKVVPDTLEHKVSMMGSNIPGISQKIIQLEQLGLMRHHQQVRH